MNRLCSALAAGLLGTLVGCGDGPVPLYPVHGKVTLDDKPLVGKTIKFIPDDGTPGQGAGATTNADGSYTILAVRPGSTRDLPGAPAGTYRVVVVEPLFPVELEVQDSSSNETVIAIGPPALEKKKKQDIPVKYTKPETTPLKVTVPEGGGALNLAVETDKKK